MSYGFLTESDIFYSYKVLCSGMQVAGGDGTLTCQMEDRTGKDILHAVKVNIMIALTKDSPSLAGRDVKIEITSLNRI